MEKLTTLDQVNAINSAHYYRGLLINEFTGLEKTIEAYITKYFLKDDVKGNEFSNIVLDRLTFEAKRTAFKTIYDKITVEKMGFTKTKNNTYPNNSFFLEIRRLNDHRVFFAHYLVVAPTEVNENIIGLAEFRDYVKIKWYTLKMFTDIIEDIGKAIKKVELYISEL